MVNLLGVYVFVCTASTVWAQDVPSVTDTTINSRQDETEKPAADKSAATQEEEPKQPKPYEFSIQKSIETTDVKSQGRTGTCWCFATTSFIESELIRQGKGKHDLSEIFIVKNVYLDKAQNYLRRQGKANFGEGAFAHDLIRAASEQGLVPESIYSGLAQGATEHDHGEMFAATEGMLGGLVKQRTLSPNWPKAFSRVTDVYLGETPAEFSYMQRDFTPKSFAEYVGFDAKNYVSITSFNHHPFGEPFVLEIPDNFSNGLFQNMPIDDLVAIVDNAIANGYSVAWDGDVSERGFSRSSGIAVLPTEGRSDYAKFPGEELTVDQEMRQRTFEEHTTTDDHLMHLTGIATDQNGSKYYLIKNSWGEVGQYNGYLYMSEAYLRLKTIAILVHKDAVKLEQPPSGATADAKPES